MLIPSLFVLLVGENTSDEKYKIFRWQAVPMSFHFFLKLSSSMGHRPLSVSLFLCLLSASTWAALCSSSYLRVIAHVSFFFICNPGLVLCLYREVPYLILHSAATSLHCQFSPVWRRKGGLYLIFNMVFLASLTLHKGRQVGHRVIFRNSYFLFSGLCFPSN